MQVNTAQTWDTGQVSVTTSATLIKAVNLKRLNVCVTNTHATADLYVGANKAANLLTTSTGYKVPAGQSFTIENTDDVYGVASTGTLTACWAEEIKIG